MTDTVDIDTVDIEVVQTLTVDSVVVYDAATDTVVIQSADTVSVAIDMPNVILSFGIDGPTNADTLNGQPGSFYQDADNINAGMLAIEHGGTGASTPENARTALDVYSRAETDAAVANRQAKASALSYFFAGGM